MELDEDTPELNAPWSSYYKGGKNGQKNSLGTFWKDLNNLKGRDKNLDKQYMLFFGQYSYAVQFPNWGNNPTYQLKSPPDNSNKIRCVITANGINRKYDVTTANLLGKGDGIDIWRAFIQEIIDNYHDPVSEYLKQIPPNASPTDKLQEPPAKAKPLKAEPLKVEPLKAIEPPKKLKEIKVPYEDLEEIKVPMKPKKEPEPIEEKEPEPIEEKEPETIEEFEDTIAKMVESQVKMVQDLRRIEYEIKMLHAKPKPTAKDLKDIGIREEDERGLRRELIKIERKTDRLREDLYMIKEDENKRYQAEMKKKNEEAYKKSLADVSLIDNEISNDTKYKQLKNQLVEYLPENVVGKIFNLVKRATDNKPFIIYDSKMDEIASASSEKEALDALQEYMIKEREEGEKYINSVGLEGDEFALVEIRKGNGSNPIIFDGTLLQMLGNLDLTKGSHRTLAIDINHALKHGIDSADVEKFARKLISLKTSEATENTASTQRSMKMKKYSLSEINKIKQMINKRRS